ncbi:unnamed protein product [Trichobilharzia regenti]|nr:unnamed protein product [Trichobilharzia regenti]
MANRFAYANMQQASQDGYPPFHYPTSSGDQNAQLLQGYALSQQGNLAAGVPGSMFGAQSAVSSNRNWLQPVLINPCMPSRRFPSFHATWR